MNIEDVKQLLDTFRSELVAELTTIKDELLSTSSIIKKFDSKFTSIFKRIDAIKNASDNAQNTANQALETAKRNEELIAKFSTDLDEIKTKNDDLEKQIIEHEKTNSTLIIKSIVLEKRLEDQVNRSCRKSLVFRGIDEQGNESWEDTKCILAEKIAAVCNISEDNSYNMIERCHRSAPNNRKKGKRDIYVGFLDWNDSEFVKDKFRTVAIKGKHNGVFVDQKYGADTTWRRNQALLARKELMKSKTITSGYVAFPAKLLVKYKKQEKKYTMHTDFSDVVVTVDNGSREDHREE